MSELKISAELEKNSVFEKSKHCFFLLVNVKREIFLLAYKKHVRAL